MLVCTTHDNKMEAIRCIAYLSTSNGSLFLCHICTYTRTHTSTNTLRVQQSCAILFFLRRIRGFVAVGVGDESHRQITTFQTAFKLLPLQSGAALITDNSFHFNKEFWRTHLSFYLKVKSYVCQLTGTCTVPAHGALHAVSIPHRGIIYS